MQKAGSLSFGIRINESTKEKEEEKEEMLWPKIRKQKILGANLSVRKKGAMRGILPGHILS